MKSTLLGDVIAECLFLVNSQTVWLLGLLCVFFVFYLSFTHSISLYRPSDGYQHPFTFAFIVSLFFSISFTLIILMVRYWFKFLTNAADQTTPHRPLRNHPSFERNLNSSLSPPRGASPRHGRTASPGGLSRRSVSPERSRLNV